MWRYVPGVKELPAKCQKTHKKARNKAYDHNIRTRKFIPSWKDQYKWVTYNSEVNKMYCEFCLAYPNSANKAGLFFVGTSNFSVCSLKSHSSFKEHLKSEGLFKASQIPAGQSTAEKMLRQLNSQKLKQLTNLFKTCNALGKRGHHCVNSM